MGYRDDVDTLYTRAMILQRELDQATEKLADRDAELARYRGTAFAREATTPGVAELRSLPDPQQVLSRLIDTLDSRFDRSDAVVAESERSADFAARAVARNHSRGQLLETVRERVGNLDDEALVIIGAIVEELGDARAMFHADDRIDVRAHLRPLVEQIGAAYRLRR